MPETDIPHFTLLPLFTDSDAEPSRYDCSLCDLDIYNPSMHAWYDHQSRAFTVDNDPTPRPSDGKTPDHPCGINGCSYDGNHDGPHSWETQVNGGSSVEAHAATYEPAESNPEEVM